MANRKPPPLRTGAKTEDIVKSTRHSKITGDFAEALVLYWLSRSGFECARVDHTGIDLIARNPDTNEFMGISVKSRSRYAGTESQSVNLAANGFIKARKACKAFGNCVPYYAIVVDTLDAIRCFLISLEHLERLVGSDSNMHYWRMDRRHLDKYRSIPEEIRTFELTTADRSWGMRHDNEKD